MVCDVSSMPQKTYAMARIDVRFYAAMKNKCLLRANWTDFAQEGFAANAAKLARNRVDNDLLFTAGFYAKPLRKE